MPKYDKALEVEVIQWMEDATGARPRPRPRPRPRACPAARRRTLFRRQVSRSTWMGAT
eukprot:SAG31_NODE_49_length_30599_cov_15.615016_7_plen_58_part_00